MATPQDNYITPGRAGFIGQIGNIGSNNGLAGSSQNASVGGTANNGVQSSNASTSAAFAVVRTNVSPSGMGGGNGGSAGAVSTSSFSPPAIQQDTKSAILSHDTPATFSSSTSPINFPAESDTNIVVSGQNFMPRGNSDFPRGNEVIELPSPVGFNKVTSSPTIAIAGGVKQNLTGITNTLANAGENDLTLTQVDNFGQAKVDPNKKIDGASQQGQQVPLYTPANEPGGQGPASAHPTGLAGNRSNSSLLPNSNG